MRKVFPEVKRVFFFVSLVLFFFVFFCPFGQSKMRQFAIVWLPSQSSCMWHWVHHTLLCGTIHASLCPLSRYFWHSTGLVELGTKSGMGKSGLDDHLFFTAGFGSGHFLKYKTLVFITTVALSYTNWPCWFNYGKAAGQSRRKTVPVLWNGRRDAEYRVLPEGGARHAKCLKFHLCKRGKDDWSLPGDVTPFVCVKSSVRSVT